MEVCKYNEFIHNEDNDDYDIKFYKQMGSNLPVINNLDDLVRELRLIFDSDKVNIDLVHYVMKSYKSVPSDWKKFAKFDRFRFNNLDDLVRELRLIFDNGKVKIDLVHYIMKPYKSVPSDYKKFAKFDRVRYTRNLVDHGNGKYNLMTLCWGEGHGSAIHDHADSHCFMKMLQGSLEEIRFAWPEEEGEQLKEIGRKPLKLNDVAYINDSIGLHRVENVSSVDTAISLHLYCPPYNKCTVFNQSTGFKSTATVTFYSAFGKRIKENKEIREPEDN